jgi:type IV pilus assembly protein PilQ
MIAHMQEGHRRAVARGVARLAAAVAIAAATGIMSSATTTVPVRLVGVTADPGAVLIEATEPVAYSVSRPDPLTLLVDMRNVAVADAEGRVSGRGLVTDVAVEQATAVDGKSIARVRVSLDRPAEYNARSSRNTIRIELTPRPGAVRAASRPARAERTPAPAATTIAAAAGSTATSIEQVRAFPAPSRTTVTLSGNGHLAPARVSESVDAPRRLVLDFPNVTSRAPNQTIVDSTLVTRVRVGLNSSEPLVTRVVMEIADGATYRVERDGQEGRDFSVVFEAGQSKDVVMVAPPTSPEPPSAPEPPITMQQAVANAAPLAPPPDYLIDPMSALDTVAPKSTGAATAAPAPAAAVRTTAAAPSSARVAPPVALSPGVASGASALRQLPPVAPPQVPATRIAAAPQQAPQPPAPAPASAQPAPQPPASAPAPATGLTGQISGDGQRTYTGHPVSLDFQGVDLRAVLRSFAEISGLNMVIDPDVQGTVDIVLTDVPWDQALDVILRGNQLDYQVDGTIVRIARIETLKKEQDSKQALAKAEADAGTLEVRTHTLSYARASAAAPLIKRAALSARGDIQTDDRTNTLIMTDLPEKLDTAAKLIATLDRPEPQVEIEARVVSTSRDFSRTIGVQWGLNGRVSPELGNTTNLAFPNRGSIGGRQGNVQGGEGTDVRANPLDQAGSVVNLPASPAAGAIGLAMGSVNGAFNLDVALSALESSGKIRILSTPRVTTQNNVRAEMTQGVQIPVQTVANNTVTVQFKDAALTLRVTPQITAASTVIMQVELENAAPGEEVLGIPSINTQRALTTVQVSDGATTIIGGVFISEQRTESDRVPYLHRLPLLGWLFKRDGNSDDSRELLIFITPRILKG